MSNEVAKLDGIQKIIDDLDSAVYYVGDDLKPSLRRASQLLLDTACSEEQMHEDELPPDMPKEDYDQWFAQSRLSYGARGVRIGPRYPFAAPAPESEVSEPKDADDLHRWEIEPHPYDSSYNIMITDSDKAAAEAIQYAAEMYLWDGIEESETRTLKVTLNNVPNIDPPESPSPTPPASTGTEELLPDASVTYPCIVDHKTLVACLHTVEQILRKPDDESRIARFGRTRDKLFAQARTAPTPSLDTEKEARQAFEDIAHLARERVNVPANEGYALLERIDRRASVALADLSARREQSEDKGHFQ